MSARLIILPMLKFFRSRQRRLMDNLLVAVGVVLVWRGVWYILDWIDYTFLGGHHLWTALMGIALGLLVLYLPDRDLKELGKL